MNLKAKDVETLGDGMHSDGGYLWLRVRGNARSWFVRGPRINGKKPEVGLGSTERVSLALARQKRNQLVAQWKEGKDPVAERRAAREAAANRKTFAEVARLKLDVLKSGTQWRTSAEGRETTLDSWTRDLTAKCAPIAGKAIDEITVDDVKRVLAPHRGHVSACHNLMNRISAVFGFAIVNGLRTGANPAGQDVAREILPKKPAAVHHAALPWAELPAFLGKLAESDAVAARIVEFAILTATRSLETRGAKWSEIDLNARTWTIPVGRMKKGKSHIVPLSDQAIALLERVRSEGEYVFPAYEVGSRTVRADRPTPNAGVHKLVKRLAGEADVTTHGFRSTFRDWCGDHGIDRDLAEHSLAHKLGDSTERAYFRSDLLARRRPVMQQWGDYCAGLAAPVVVPFKRVG
jgi:integrase